MHRLSVVLACVCSLVATVTLVSAAAGGPDHKLPNHKEKNVCEAPGPETAACLAKVVTELDDVTPLATPSYEYGYDPSDLARAYNWADPVGSTWSGNGVTIAIVDAYDNPNAYADLTVYRAQFGLPPCTTESGCFRKVNQNGAASPLPTADVGWGQEIDLDIEMASAVCPQCAILLVESNSSSILDLGTAVNRAALMGAEAISNSYGTSNEFRGETSYDSYYNHPGIAITASSGDSGYGTSFPAVSNHVVAVGGTSLVEDGSARTFSETAWSGAGSGCSTYFSKPSWQTDAGCARRAEADVSAVANPSTGVAVYDSYGSSGGNWYVFGGTSVSAPIIAGAYGLAYNGAVTDYPARLLYANPVGLFDVVGGSNGNCSQSYLCNAVAGFDGPTGFGTPNGLASFSTTAPAPDFSLSVSPSSRTVTVGTNAGYTVTVTPTGGFSNLVSLSVSAGLPVGATATFTPPSTKGGTSALSITTTGVLSGTYPLTISGSDGVLTHTATATLVVQPVPVGDFTIGVSPSSKKINQNGASTYTISIGRINGFPGVVSFTASGLPASGLTASFSPNPASGSNSTLTLTAKTLPHNAVYTVTIIGTSGGLSHSTTLSLTVK